MSPGFYEVLLSKIRERKKQYSDAILSDSVSIKEYKKMRGRLNGIEEAEQMIKESFKKIYEE